MLTVSGKTGTRTMPLAPAAITLLTNRSEGRGSDELLFTRDDGKPWAHSDWDESVKAAATRAKLPNDVVLYTLRHSFITQLLMDGAPTLEVARLVGTSVQMIEKHYGHLVETATRSRLAKVRLLWTKRISNRERLHRSLDKLFRREPLSAADKLGSWAARTTR
jgi:site-specific recombinase XerD